MAEMITIRKSDYLTLVEDQKLLLALQATGVVNWHGYEEAMNILNTMEQDED